MTLELRCVECRWLDPKLWSSMDKCACLHYWQTEQQRQKLHQCNLTHRIDGHSWSYLTQR